MLAHSDAVGYVNDLAKEVDEQWFTMVCDAAVSGLSIPDDLMLRELAALYTKKASYVGIKSRVAAVATPVPPTDWLEECEIQFQASWGCART